MNTINIYTVKEPWERGERIPHSRWYTTMYYKGFQEVWNKKAGKKNYVQSLVTKAFLSGMENPDQILTLIKAWGKKHKLTIDEEDVWHKIIPEQDAYTRKYRDVYKWRQYLRRVEGKLSFRIREFMLTHGVTSRKQLAAALGEDPNTIKKQLQRLMVDRKVVSPSFGKFELTESHRVRFAKVIAMKEALAAEQPIAELEAIENPKTVIIDLNGSPKGIFHYYYGHEGLYKLWEKLRIKGKDRFLRDHPDFVVVTEREFCDIHECPTFEEFKLERDDDEDDE